MASKRGSLSQKKITGELALAIEQAATLMKRKKQRVMTAEILLLGFVNTPNVEANQLLRSLSNQHNFSWADFEREVDRAAGDTRPAPDQQFDFITADGKRVSLGKEMLIILDDGLTLAENESMPQCSSAHVLVAMAGIQVGTHWLFQKRGLDQRTMLNEATYQSPASATPAAQTKTRTRVSSTIYHRAKLESKLVNLLSMRSARNVILVGPPGTGKRSLVLGVGQLIVQGSGPFGLRSVVELDERKLLDNPQRAISDAINQAKEGILFVPDVDRFFGGIRAEFLDDSNSMQKAFLANNVVVIGTATEEAYSKKLKSVRVVTEHSQLLKVPPASVEETTEILKAIKPRFETDYDLQIVDKSLDETARLAGRYYTIKPLPGGAVELLHRACAMVKTGGHVGSGVHLTDSTQLDPDDVMIITSLLTGIPVNSMGADERNRYIKMVDQLKTRIIGQDEAVVVLSRAVKIARVGLKDPKRPIGSFLFLGPTGVGKSELAKALAEFMFGTERALITLDMSEYMDESSVNRLIGSPPGYVGHEAGGQLTDAIKKQPYSVILFDEVEKANRKVFDTLLQVLDEGRLTSGQGETVTFSECVILMTSNIGGEYLADVRMSEDVGGDTNPESNGGSLAYNAKNIGTMLAEGFSSNELLTLFGSNLLSFSAADTPPVAESPPEESAPIEAVDTPGDKAKKTAPAKKSAKSDKADIIALILYQAEQKAQFELVLELAEAQNPAKFEQHQPYYNWPVACQKAEKALKGHFRPEFLNRLDGIIYFHPLNDKYLRDILGLMLNQERKMLQNQGLDLDVTGAAKSWLIKQNDHPEWGARPLRRLIQNYIREEVAEYILRENPSSGEVIKVQVQNNEMKISSVKPGK